MGILDDIKSDVKKTGQSKGKLFFVKEGQKARIRFLQDMDEGIKIKFHDSYEKSINVPCKEEYGKECDYCEQEGLRTRDLYCWSVWDYENKEVKLFLFAVNNCSPLPAIAALYESYDTLVDRDYVLSVTGKAQNKSYTVVPQDKAKFRNDKAKPYSKKKVLELIKQAFPDDNDNSDDDYEEEKKSKKQSKSKDDDWGDEGAEKDYSEMSAKELYNLCKDRKIDAETRKPVKYYVGLLEEWDNAQDDWGDEDGDEWEE